MNEIEMASKRFGLLDSLPLGVCVLRQDFVVLYWNDCLEMWTGISRDNIVGSNIVSQFPHLGEPKYKIRLVNIFEGGPPTTFSSQLHKYTIQSPLPNGDFRIQQTTVISVPAFDGAASYAVFAIQDVTDLSRSIQEHKAMRDQALEEIRKRERAEEQLRTYSVSLEEMVEERTSELKAALKNLQETQSHLLQSEKMASVGQLAAGIAHEINTPTQYVADNTRFLQEAFGALSELLRKHAHMVEAIKRGDAIDDHIRELEEAVEEADLAYLSEEVPKAIEQSLEGVGRIATIVRSMKEFSHPGTAEKTAIDINRALETTITVARNEWKYVADMETDFDPSLPPVPCLPGDFNQVILNLIVNAAHAIAEVVGDGSNGKGTINISTRCDGDWAKISVSDTGKGIPEEIKDRIYEPFFTTKEVGQGTGQGLAVSRSVIVDKHSGTIDFETDIGKGTTFNIRIPLGGDAPSKGPNSEERDPIHSSPGQTSEQDAGGHV